MIRYLGGGRKLDLGPGRAATNLGARVYGRLTSDQMAQGGRGAISKLKGTGQSREFHLKRGERT